MARTSTGPGNRAQDKEQSSWKQPGARSDSPLTGPSMSYESPRRRPPPRPFRPGGPAQQQLQKNRKGGSGRKKTSSAHQESEHQQPTNHRARLHKPFFFLPFLPVPFSLFFFSCLFLVFNFGSGRPCRPGWLVCTPARHHAAARPPCRLRLTPHLSCAGAGVGIELLGAAAGGWALGLAPAGLSAPQMTPERLFQGWPVALCGGSSHSHSGLKLQSFHAFSAVLHFPLPAGAGVCASIFLLRTHPTERAKGQAKGTRRVWGAQWTGQRARAPKSAYAHAHSAPSGTVSLLVRPVSPKGG